MSAVVPASDSVTELPSWPADVAVHPAAELFPLMTGKDFAELVQDIRTNGLVDPIVRTVDGRILDGRNRYRACVEAGVEPSFRIYDGEPWRFVISTNLHRRHLTDGQRAMIAAKMADRRGGRPKTPSYDGVTPPPTQAEVAELLAVPVTHITRARTVVKDGTEALRAAVESGAVPVYTAARVAALSGEKQDAFVREVEAGVDPRKAAPSQATAPRTSAAWSLHRADRTVLNRVAVTKVVQMAGGLKFGLSDTTSLDQSITSEEAARWLGDLSEGIRSLRRLHSLLKERTS